MTTPPRHPRRMLERALNRRTANAQRHLDRLKAEQQQALAEDAAAAAMSKQQPPRPGPG